MYPHGYKSLNGHQIQSYVAWLNHQLHSSMLNRYQRKIQHNRHRTKNLLCIYAQNYGWIDCIIGYISNIDVKIPLLFTGYGFDKSVTMALVAGKNSGLFVSPILQIFEKW